MNTFTLRCGKCGAFLDRAVSRCPACGITLLSGGPPTNYKDPTWLDRYVIIPAMFAGMMAFPFLVIFGLAYLLGFEVW